METLRFDLSQEGNRFKLLNATNGGPWHKRKATSQIRSNFADYKAARIPYSRNHDLAVHGVYGGPFSHDISCIFPNFDADPTDPASYDFACTDEDILVCLEAGTKTFFRLGQTIEHQIKKHHTLPPKDFKKWAVICEHIIRHYTEGWADGFYHDMPYWEIWNEPDLDKEDAPVKRTWGGTTAQFYDLYETASKHLKSCFPHLKIGGPALAHGVDWADKFLEEMSKRNVPIDFFSWHTYNINPLKIAMRGQKLHDLLVKYGYGDAESILNEWNYVKEWGDKFPESLAVIHGMKGAAFLASCICTAQHNHIDMLMYYDTRPSVFNGVFDFYTYEKLKGYYPLYWYGMFYDMEKEIPAAEEVEDIFYLCGVDKDGKVLSMLVHYSDEEVADKTVHMDFGKSGKYQVYRLDETHDAELVGEVEDTTFTLKNCTVLLIKEI